MQKRYWKITFASLIASTPNVQVIPSTDKIAAALLTFCRTPTFLSVVTLVPEARRDRKMTTKAVAFPRRINKTGARNPTKNGKPLTRQL